MKEPIKTASTTRPDKSLGRRLMIDYKTAKYDESLWNQSGALEGEGAWLNRAPEPRVSRNIYKTTRSFNTLVVFSTVHELKEEDT
jgi:hypothetical protein